MFVHFGTHVLIVEIDENQHKGYDTSCDNKRVCALYQDFGYIPIVFVRFNPDDYYDANGKKVASCFDVDEESRICRISNMKEFEDRINVLCSTIEKYIDAKDLPFITRKRLFFDKN